MKYKTATKVGGGLVGGSGVIIVLIALNAHLEAKIQGASDTSRLYVDSKHEVVMSEIESLKRGQKDIKDLLRVIDNRLYQLKKRKGEQNG